jgi:predicted phosphodiesterase
MKILILSDIHGNWPALQAVQVAESKWDALFFLGDVIDTARNLCLVSISSASVPTFTYAAITITRSLMMRIAAVAEIFERCPWRHESGTAG